MAYCEHAAGWLFRIGRAFRSALFPHRCLGCDQFYFPPEYGDITSRMPETLSEKGSFQDLVTPFLCLECSHSITLLRSPLCRVCGMPYAGDTEEDHTCGGCLKSSWSSDSARACGTYDLGLKRLIHGLKYQPIPQLAHPLGVLLAWGFETYFKDQTIDWVVPVPLHPKRMRRRGFNQAHLIAREAFSRNTGKPLPQNAFAIDETLLTRIRFTPPQTGLGRELRRKNIRNAFRVGQSATIKDRSILLVDDVFTTGATVNECAKTLKDAGACWVGVLSLARAL